MNKSVFILGAVLFIAFQWYYFFGAPRLTLESPADAVASDKDSVKEAQTITNFYLVDAKGAKKEFELWATEANKPMGEHEWKLQNVKVQFYTESATYTVFGDKGTVNEEQRGMLIEGDVRMNSSNGYLFNTDRLMYNAQTKEITTASAVTLRGPKEDDGRLQMDGTGLYVDLNKSYMLLKDKVSGFKPMSEGRTMKISSQLAEFSGVNYSAQFKNNVLIRAEQMRVRGNFAEFRYKDKKLDTLYMDGGIHMQDANKMGTAGEAIVYFNEDKYVFRKKPFLTQSENELIGDEVVVLDRGRRVQVKKAKIQYFDTEKEQ